MRYRLEEIGWTGELPKAWQFLHIDSPTAQDGVSFPAPLLPQDNYLSLVPNPKTTYGSLIDSIERGFDTKLFLDMKRSLPPAAEVRVPISLGAGAYRAVGRAISASTLERIAAKISVMTGAMTAGDASGQLRDISGLLNVKIDEKAGSRPAVILISSVAGGSGAGMFIDVAEAAKAAMGNAPWKDEIFSLLYAPDVFEELGATRMATMVPNALGAITELSSGIWRLPPANTPTPTTMELYRKSKATPSLDGIYNVGPSFNYVVGRKNSANPPVDFTTQEGTYLAVAQSLAAWMTNFNVQDDLLAYAVANRMAVSTQTPDSTGLKPTGAWQPLSSIGFARVTLGLDKFADYSSERLAKQTLKTILSQHLSQDPQMVQKTEEQWLQHHADLQLGDFVKQSGLDELTEANNDVVDALRPNLTEVMATLSADIEFQLSQGTPRDGHAFETWVSRITHAYELSVAPRIADAIKLTDVKARDWVQTTPTSVLELVRKTIAQQGLPVTIELLSRLIDQSKAAANELIDERARHLADSTQVAYRISETLGPAQSMPKIPKSHPLIADAVASAIINFEWLAYAEAKKTASELLVDLARNFLEPLKLTLSRALGTLIAGTSASNLPDSRSNPFETWPDFNSVSVDHRFKPAPNEQVLLDWKTFPKQFDQLITQTVSNPQLTASRVVIAEMLGGSRLLEGVAELAENHHWSILDLESNQMWVPSESRYRFAFDQASQPARFHFETDHMKYVDFAKQWSRIPGRAFAAFLDQKIVSYLAAAGNTQESAARNAEFVKAIGNAVKAASPLVSLDTKLLEAAHRKIGTFAICSGIPLDSSDPSYKAVVEILGANGFDLSNPDAVGRWFKSSGQGSRMSSIEIFTQLETSVNPLVMDSLMGNISTQWSAASSEFDSRTTFMTWRRGRELPEAIPAHPTQWMRMLQGWHVARLLNLLANDTSHSSYSQTGPKVSIWIDPTSKFTGFPHPLYSSQTVRNVDDYPGVILESLAIAMANCSLAQSLDPLEPYKRLVELGGGDNDDWVALNNWIRKGQVESGAEMPREDRAGLPTQTEDERRAACVAYINQMRDEFEERVQVDPHKDPNTYPIVWEIRDELRTSFDKVLEAVNRKDGGREL